MTTSLVALAAFLGWALLLLMITINYRGAMVMMAKRKADAWTRGRDPQDMPFFERAKDAYSNILEIAPIFVGVILLAQVSDQAAITNGLAWVFVGARVAQSVAHMISINHWMIFLVRFPAFLLQVVILIWWLVGLTGLV